MKMFQLLSLMQQTPTTWYCSKDNLCSENSWTIEAMLQWWTDEDRINSYNTEWDALFAAIFYVLVFHRLLLLVDAHYLFDTTASCEIHFPVLGNFLVHNTRNDTCYVSSSKGYSYSCLCNSILSIVSLQNHFAKNRLKSVDDGVLTGTVLNAITML